jgi:3'(2'), 5'-bisphosphate nucleotidase
MTDLTSPATDDAVAAQLAREAGELLRGLRTERAAAGVSGKALGREGDQAAHELLMKRLAELRPEDPVLSEEGERHGTDRRGRPRVWIVDPLDGTREYGEADRWDWAVHVALAVDGRAAVGAVALPGRDLVLATDPAPVLPARQDTPPRVVVSRTRPPEEADRVAAALGGELVPLGSAGAKTMAVVLGEAEAYVHAGGQYEWDSAAPVAVAAAAGLHVSRLDGSELTYNHPDPYLPDLLVCRPELADTILDAAN